MAKKYKIKKSDTARGDPDAPKTEEKYPTPRTQKRQRTPEEIKEYKKLALILFPWLVLIISVYFAFVRYSLQERNPDMMTAVMCAYLGLGIAFFFLWMVFNGGLKKFDASAFEKPEEMGYDEFCAVMEKLKKRHRQSKYFMIIGMPFIIALLIDLIMIVWGN